MFVWHIQDNNQRVTLAVFLAFTVLSGLAVTARICARYLQRMRLAANDYAMILALIFTWGICTCGILSIFFGGVGLHQDVVASTNPESLEIFGILIFAIQLIWPVGQALVKVSMCLLYLSIFPGARFRMITLMLLSLCVMFAASVLLITLLICQPLGLQWDPTISGVCGDRSALWLWSGILNVVTDALVIYLPMPMVWKLYIPRGKKLMLTGLFGAGVIVTIVSIVRLHCVLMVDFASDTTYTVTHALYWSLLESTLGIIAGCLPVAGPAVRRIVPASIAKRWSYIRSSTSGGPDHYSSSQGRPGSSPFPAFETKSAESGAAAAAGSAAEDGDIEAQTGKRSTGEWFCPTASRAPTPHPCVMLDRRDKTQYHGVVVQEKAASIEITRAPAPTVVSIVPATIKDVGELGDDGKKDELPRVTSTEVHEGSVVDSMERGEGIMVKVEWEVSSDTRASWPISRYNSCSSDSRKDGGGGGVPGA